MDTSQGKPGDALEYTAGAGGAAFVIGPAENSLAVINSSISYVTDTPDFWRREGAKYPTHGGRFTGEPAYFRHVSEASQKLMQTAGTQPKDYTYCVLHQPNGKFPATAAKALGFSEEQSRIGLLAPRIGNTYSGAVLLGLCNVLDQAKPGDRIFVCGYGSGAGADAFDLTVTKNIDSYDRSPAERLETLLEDTTDLDYLEELIANGSYIGMDRFGVDVFLPFEDRVNTVARMCEREHAEKMVLSHDAACFMDWVPEELLPALPNWHYLHIHHDVIPALKERGVTDEQLKMMLVDNPRRIFENQGAY